MRDFTDLYQPAWQALKGEWEGGIWARERVGRAREKGSNHNNSRLFSSYTSYFTGITILSYVLASQTQR